MTDATKQNTYRVSLEFEEFSRTVDGNQLYVDNGNYIIEDAGGHAVFIAPRERVLCIERLNADAAAPFFVSGRMSSDVVSS